MSQLNDNLVEIKRQKDTYLLPENLKKDVELLGVTGTLEEGVDTSDADATVDDIAENKTAYVNGTKIIGKVPTINANAASSYMDASNITITDKPQFNMLDCYFTFTNDVLHRKNSKEQLNFFYDKIINAIGLSADKIKKGETILGVTGTYQSENNAKIIPRQGNYNGIAAHIEYVDDNYDISQVTNLSYLFSNCFRLKKAPIMNTSHITNATGLFSTCESLVTVPVYDFSSVTGTNNYNMFNYCPMLSNESLYNILQTCITMTGVTNKTLKYMGLSAEQINTCKTLSNYQAFLDAGWSSGYSD